MDHFWEEVVVKHKRTAEEAAYFLTLPMMVILAIFAMMNISAVINFAMSGHSLVSLLPTLAIGLVSAGAAVLLFLFRDRLRTEYEYTFTNGELDFAQVFNNSKRKSLGSLKAKGVEAFGKVASSSFQRYVSMRDVQQLRWYLNRDAELYYFFFQKDGKKSLIVFEPSEDMVRLVRQYLPHGVEQG